MKMFYRLCMLTVILAGTLSLQAQRFLEPVFSRADIAVEENVVYGTNVSILPQILVDTIDTPVPVPLLMDVYQPDPSVDTLEERPLILFAITGTFFPAYANSGFTGERTDSAVVEIARRFTTMGYVVAVVQYRRGWIPTATEILAQKTILQAAYRGILDLRNAVRYFRWSADQDSNRYKVDVERIAVGGTGTGGYVSNGVNFLSDFGEIEITKFIDFEIDPPAPFIDTTIHGNIYGTNQTFGVDSLGQNIANYPEYSSSINVGFSMDGAVGDTGFVDEADPPFISVHSAFNPGAPYDIGDVIATNASTGLPFAVIPTAAGGLGALRKATAIGNQDIFDRAWDDPYSAVAGTRNEGALGLLPLITPGDQVGTDAMCLGTGVPGDTLLHYDQPWAWFNPAIGAATWNFVFADAIAAEARPTGEVAVCRSVRGIPNDPDIARAYLDTAIGFIAPRLFVAMDLGSSGVSVNQYIQDNNVEVYPNPAGDRFTVSYRTNARKIDEVSILDYTGRSVRTYTNLNTQEAELNREGLSPGIYLLRVQVGENFVAKRIQFD